VHLHPPAMLVALPQADPTALVRPRALWGSPTVPWPCHAHQRSSPCSQHDKCRSSSQPQPPDGVRRRTTAAAATAVTEQRAMVGLGTAARTLQDSAAHVDALSDEQRAAVLAGPSHVRHAMLLRIKDRSGT